MKTEINAVDVRTAEEIATTGAGLDTDAKLAEDARLAADVQANVKLAYDPTDKLARQIKLGRAFLAQARYRRANYPKWTKVEYSALVAEHENRAKMEHSIGDVRIDVAARISAFIDVVKPSNPLVSKVSYYRIANHFLPMIAWDVEDLNATIKKEWITFLRDRIDRNADTAESKACPVAELVSAIDTEKEAIKAERAKADKRTPEQVDDAEQKAASRKIVAARGKALTAIGKAVSEAFENTTLDHDDVNQAVASVAKTFGKPANVQAPTLDPSKMSADDIVKALASMFQSGRIVDIKAIADTANGMIEMAKEAMRNAA